MQLVMHNVSLIADDIQTAAIESIKSGMRYRIMVINNAQTNMLVAFISKSSQSAAVSLCLTMLLRGMIAHALTWGMSPVGIFHAQWNSAGSVLMIRPA
jgi:hypothetical protein